MPLMDMIVPLSVESESNDDELRIMLRSAEKHCKCLGRVIVVTPRMPGWLRNAIVIPFDDELKSNKDGNIIAKVMKAIRMMRMKDDFIFCADDYAFMQDVENIPLLYNSHKPSDYSMTDSHKWHRRMARTFDFLKSRGVELEHHYDIHAPQIFNASKVMDAMRTVNYRSDIGYCIYTLFRGLTGAEGGVLQNKYKTTHETEESANANIDKMFVGYNNSAFYNGLRTRLLEIFNQKSKYEK